MMAAPPPEQQPLLVVESEDPIADQWQRLSRFEYPNNIKRHISARGQAEADPSTIEYVAGCFRQAQAYFSSARSSPLDISPLLLYYGATLLASGTLAALSAVIPPIDRHGLRLELPQDSPQI